MACERCGVRPRRTGAYRDGVPVSWGRLCRACTWRDTKASPTLHARAKRDNRRASAAFRKTPKRQQALVRHALRGLKCAAMWSFLSRDEWETLWRSQGGRCAITGEPIRNRYDPTDKTKTHAACDHSHALQKQLIAEGVDPVEATRRSIRGLLSWWGNRHVLVALRDDPDMAQRAADYLRDPPAKKVISC